MQKVDRKLYVHQHPDHRRRVHRRAARCWPRSTRNGGSAPGRRTPAPTCVHAALRQVLGPEALQAGSYNKPGYLRLDFAWHQALSAGDPQRDRGGVQPGRPRRPAGPGACTAPCRRRRRWARSRCSARPTTRPSGSSRSAARGRSSCAAAPTSSTPVQIGPIALTSESSVGSGVRRVEAAVGIEAFRKLAAERSLLVNQLAGTLKVQPAELPGRIETLVDTAPGGREGAGEVPGRGWRWRRPARWPPAPSTVGDVAAGGGRRARGHRRRPTCGRWPPTSAVGSPAGPAVVALFAPGQGSVSFVVALTPAAGRALAAGDLAKSLLPASRVGAAARGPRQGAGTWRSRSCRPSAAAGGGVGSADLAQSGAGNPAGRLVPDSRIAAPAGAPSAEAIPTHRLTDLDDG